ncbi:MAG TPA: hypothetical protein VF460_00105 [Burkholderiales bacterium]
METESLNALLDDAELVLKYAVRAGRLPDDSLSNAITGVRAHLGAGGNGSLAQLSKAMSNAVAAIAPITLMDLRAGRSPFEKDAAGPSRQLQYWLCALTVFLAVLIAFYSFSVQRKEGALREYQEIRAANIPEKVDAVYRLAQQEEVRARKDPRYEQYQRALNEIQNLDARDQAAVNLLAEQSLAAEWPFQGQVHALIDWASGLLSHLPSSPAYDRISETPYADMCHSIQHSVTVSRPGKNSHSVWQQVVMQEELSHSCFKQMTGIKHGVDVETVALLYSTQIRDSVSLLSVWILPFLSGLLGATVFLLRDSLNPLTPNFGVPRAVVRLSLGGIAGIIIGWFWAPSGAIAAEVGRGSSIPLALAFVTGFSIDILYAALDRLRDAFTAARDPKSARR